MKQGFVMTKYLGYCIVFTGLAICAQGKTLSDEALGKYSGKVAANLLSENSESKDGILLQKLAEVLTPMDDTVLLTKALLKRARPPQPVKTKVTKAKLIKAYLARAKYWSRKDLEKDGAARFKAILYYKAIDLLTLKAPINEVLIALAKFEKKGYQTNLDLLLASRGRTDKREPMNTSTSNGSTKGVQERTADNNTVAEPKLEPTQSTRIPVVALKRPGSKGRRGSLNCLSDRMAFHLDKLKIYPSKERSPAHGYLQIKWAAPTKGRYISYTKELTECEDNNRVSLIKDYRQRKPAIISDEQIDRCIFSIPISPLDTGADRISRLRGVLVLQHVLEYKTLTVDLPVKLERHEGGVTVLPTEKKSRGIYVKIKLTDTPTVSMEALAAGATVVARYPSGAESSSYIKSRQSSRTFEKRGFTFGDKFGVEPVSVKITYPSILKTEEYPFEFYDIGLPDSTGIFDF